jgi:hypothetical protein
MVTLAGLEITDHGSCFPGDLCHRAEQRGRREETKSRARTTSHMRNCEIKLAGIIHAGAGPSLMGRPARHVVQARLPGAGACPVGGHCCVGWPICPAGACTKIRNCGRSWSRQVDECAECAGTVQINRNCSSVPNYQCSLMVRPHSPIFCTRLLYCTPSTYLNAVHPCWNCQCVRYSPVQFTRRSHTVVLTAGPASSYRAEREPERELTTSPPSPWLRAMYRPR